MAFFPPSAYLNAGRSQHAEWSFWCCNGQMKITTCLFTQNDHSMTLPAEINSTFEWGRETLQVPAIYCTSLEYVGGLIFHSPFLTAIQSPKVQDYTDGNVHQTKTLFFGAETPPQAMGRGRNGFAAVWRKGRCLCVGKGNEGSQRTHHFSSWCFHITELLERNEQNRDAKGWTNFTSPIQNFIFY